MSAFTVMAQYKTLLWHARKKWLENYTLSTKGNIKTYFAAAIKLKLYLVLNGYGPYKHIAVCVEDKPGRVLSTAVLG